MADRYRAYAPPSSHDRDPRGDYLGYRAPEGSLSSYYASRPSVLPGVPDIIRNNVPLASRTYGLDGSEGVINNPLPGLSGLAAGATAQGLGSPLEDPAFPRLSGVAPARAQGSSMAEDPALANRSVSIGKSAIIPDVERQSPLLNLDRPSEDESNIIFVDGLPTDCTRREVAHLFRPFVGFKDIRVVHKEPRHSGDKAYVLCFVEFENAKFAFTAMEALQEYRFDDRKPDAPVLKIKFARFPFRLPAAHDDMKPRAVR